MTLSALHGSIPTGGAAGAWRISEECEELPMNRFDHAREEDGWRQVRAAVSLIAWSRLARFDAQQLVFHAAEEHAFEFGLEGHPGVHHEFGRLICWIAFSVGGEYLSKGTCLLKGCDLTTTVAAIRPPSWDEDLRVWAQLVNSRDPRVQVADTSLGTLGQAPVNRILPHGPDREFVSAAVRFLASTIRNRDAHRYAPNARAAHFRAVPLVLVPAFNILLGTLDQDELRRRSFGGTDA
jgi:hypothetical protein